MATGQPAPGWTKVAWPAVPADRAGAGWRGTFHPPGTRTGLADSGSGQLGASLTRVNNIPGQLAIIQPHPRIGNIFTTMIPISLWEQGMQRISVGQLWLIMHININLY